MGRVSRQLLALLLSTMLPSVGFANPTGGVVQSGNATISGQGTNVVTVNQASHHAVLSWQGFNIAPGETTNFVQPDSRAIALNRILDGQASSILGNLNANGRVYLINPNGILFGQSAVVNVGGLVAATNAQVTGLVNADLNALASAQGAPGAAIVNQGKINVAPGGDVYLVGARVENSTTGAIHVEDGTVKVASGATLELAGEDGISVDYPVPTTPDNTAVNLGQIIAERGIVDIRGSVVRQDGTVQATAAVEREGQIVLVGDSELHVDGDTATENGNIQASSGGDVVIGAGGSLRSQTGDVDVESGHDVLFTSTDRTNDSVIETGGGNIRVVAEHDVNLQPNPNAAGNTAIRTRGIDVTDPTGRQLHEKGDGGNVTVIAKAGDVFSGSADRWIEPGVAFDRNFLFMDYPTGYDPIPVARNGILGIGSEAGGDVTVIAGGNVRTRAASLDAMPGQRTGGTARAPFDALDPGAPPATDYDGSHIGVFGQAYENVTFDPLSQSLTGVSGVHVPLADAPRAHLTVIAGGDITGDYMVRNGDATLRAGYTVPDPSQLDQITLSAAAQADPTRGWLGSLASPLTLDLARASADGRGANGVALRVAENPALVYPSANSNVDGAGTKGTAKAPVYDGTDSLHLEAERGDVVMLGTDDVIPERPASSDPRDVTLAKRNAKPNGLIRMLPPSVSIVTHQFTRDGESRGGDLVMLNDFDMLPSDQGGLSLDIAGQVRTAGAAATGAARLTLTARTLGSAADAPFTLPTGLLLTDPKTGALYGLDDTVVATIAQRIPAMPALPKVTFALTSEALAKGITIPAGTKLLTRDGRVFSTASDVVVPPPAQRVRQAPVLISLAAPAKTAESFGPQTLFVSPDGAVFQLNQPVTIFPGQTSVAATVTARIPGGPDLAPGKLVLQVPLDGVRATNTSASTRLVETSVTAVADVAGKGGSVLPYQVVQLGKPIKGVLGVSNAAEANGRDATPDGEVPSGGTLPIAVARNVVGPAGLLPTGTELQIANPEVLPAGISPNDLTFEVDFGLGAQLTPAVFRQLQVVRDDSGRVISTRVDPAPGTVVVANPATVWTAATGLQSAHIHQSQASPDVDARGVGTIFDYQAYFETCKSGVLCSADSNSVALGSGPDHQNSPGPALLLAAGGFERVGFDLAEPATLWSGADVVDLQLKTRHVSATDLTQIVVPYGNVSFAGENQTLVDTQLGTPIQVVQAADPSSGLLVSGPGSARILVGVAPHDQPISGFDGALAALVPAPVDPTNHGIKLADWTGTPDAFTGLDERGRLAGTGDGTLTAAEAPWVPVKVEGRTVGKLELDDVGGSTSLGLVTSGNAGYAATSSTAPEHGLPAGGASLQIVTAGDVDLHRFGFVGTLQGGALTVQTVEGGISAEVPEVHTTRQRGFLTTNATVVNGGATFADSGGGDISLDANGDIDTGGSAVIAFSGSNIRVETRMGSITAGRGKSLGTLQGTFDPVTGVPSLSYEGAGFLAPTGQVHLKARKDISLGAGIRGRVVGLDAGGNITAGTGFGASASGGLQIDAGGTISGSFSASSISIGSGTISSGATVTAAVVSGSGGAVSNTGANQISASAVVSAQNGAAMSISEDAAGTANSGLRSVIIDVTSRACEGDECR